jgi:predicted dehydrogenase
MATAAAADPVRFGLVGYGTGGRLFHAPLIASAPGCVLAGVLTRSASRRADLARDHPDVPAYDSLTALARAGVTAVAISTPVDTHVGLVEEAAGLGLAVVCDKPFAPDAAGARRAVEAARRAGTVLSVYQNRRWDSEILTLRRLVDGGHLGTVHRFESRFERFRPGVAPRPAGGGTLLDLGSHLIDQALTLFGPADLVYAEVHDSDGGPGSDDDVFVALRHAGGVRSHLWASSIQGAPGPRLRVAGSTGTLIVDRLDGQEDALRGGRSPATEGDQWGVEPVDRWGRIQRGDPAAGDPADPGATGPVPRERGRWDTYYPAFADAVRGSGPAPVDPADAVAAMAVLDAARVSAATGQTLALG